MNDTHDGDPPAAPSNGDDVERFWNDLLARTGITHGHRALFMALGYGFHEPPERLPSRAEAEYNGMVGRDVVTTDDCRAALADGLARGWLQVIDQQALDRIAEELQARGVLGPLADLPPIGGVDYTAAGAKLWGGLCEQRWLRVRDELHAWTRRPFVAVDCVWLKTAHFYPSLAAAQRGIDEFRRYDDVGSITDPVPIGPWRAQWWRSFPVGYRVDVVQHSQGGRVVCGESCWLHWSRHPNLEQLRRVLDRYNITTWEWLMLWYTEEGPTRTPSDFCTKAMASARQRFRFKFLDVAEEHCRRGLEGCVRHGWLRIMDAKSDTEIQALFDREPALLAVPAIARNRRADAHWLPDRNDPGKLIWVVPPQNAHWGQLDFSLAGAQLYRTIVTEWLGSDWEVHQLRVSHEYHWKEHHYSESPEGFDDQIQEHLAHDRVVVSRREAPIGPWCIHWTHHYPAGYRMELELRTSTGLTLEELD